MESHLTSLVIRKMQITIMCFFCKHTRITNIEMIDNVKSQQAFRSSEIFIYFSDRSTNW